MGFEGKYSKDLQTFNKPLVEAINGLEAAVEDPTVMQIPEITAAGGAKVGPGSLQAVLQEMMDLIDPA